MVLLLLIVVTVVVETTLPRPHRRRIYGLVQRRVLRKGAHKVGRGGIRYGRVQRLVQVYRPVALRQKRCLLLVLLLRGRRTSIIEAVLIAF